MERGSTKHGRVLDDEMKHETQGLVQGGHSTRVEEWNDPEPLEDDAPRLLRTETPGTPDGIDAEEVAERSELARHLAPSAFPAVGAQLLEEAARAGAPETVLNRLRQLPSGREFVNVADLWEALGGGRERRP